LHLGEWHPNGLATNAPGDRHGARVSDTRLEEVIAEWSPEHRPARRPEERSLQIGEDTRKKERCIRAGPHWKQGTAEPPRRLAFAAFHSAGQV